ARAAAFQKRRMEPAAMLVGTFEINVSRPFQLGPVFQRECVRRSRIKPDIENVAHPMPALLVMVRSEEPLLGALSEPGIGAFLLKGRENAGIDGLVLKNLAMIIGENADRHSPGALARQDPVGAVFNHC